MRNLGDRNLGGFDEVLTRVKMILKIYLVY